jgi:hypothetical protein
MLACAKKPLLFPLWKAFRGSLIIESRDVARQIPQTPFRKMPKEGMRRSEMKT